jgi:hypothetical protein
METYPKRELSKSGVDAGVSIHQDAFCGESLGTVARDRIAAATHQAKRVEQRGGTYATPTCQSLARITAGPLNCQNSESLDTTSCQRQICVTEPTAEYCPLPTSVYVHTRLQVIPIPPSRPCAGPDIPPNKTKVPQEIRKRGTLAVLTI